MKRVKIKNNWESYEYYIGETKLNPKDIKIIYDNAGNKYEVTHKNERKSYNDMGHTYSAERIILCVNHPLGEIILREKSEFYVE